MQKNFILITIFILLIISIENMAVEINDGEKVKISAEYTQTLKENDNPVEIKYICYRKAIKKAVKSLSVFSDETVGINENNINYLTEVISSGYIEDIKEFEERTQDKLHYKFEAYVKPSEISDFLKKETYRIKNQTKSLSYENALLKILAVINRGSNTEIVFKVLHESVNQMEFNSQGDILFDGITLSLITVKYFTEKGEEVKTEQKSIGHKNKIGEIASLFFQKPQEAKYCKINVVKKSNLIK